MPGRGLAAARRKIAPPLRTLAAARRGTTLCQGGVRPFRIGHASILAGLGAGGAEKWKARKNTYTAQRGTMFENAYIDKATKT